MTADDPAEGFIRPAPKELCQLAQAMRGWPYDDIRQAVIAASQAGWSAGRIYREVFRLLLTEDSGPADLRAAARSPVSRLGPRGSGVPRDPQVVSLVEQAKRAADAATAAQQAQARGARRDGDPEGGEAA